MQERKERFADWMDVMEAENTLPTLQHQKMPKCRIVTDAVTGLPVLTAGKAAATLSSREVDEILSHSSER